MSGSISSTHPFVTMKGKKDGLILILDETCSYAALVAELKNKLSASRQPEGGDPVISVRVQAGNRYLSKAQRLELTETIDSFHSMEVEKIESNVMTIDEFKRRQADGRLMTTSQIVRSGQVLSVQGNILLIGDVNPGGTIQATGNIYILGALRGLACAGMEESRPASFITASLMKPTQLRIGQCIGLPQDPEPADGTTEEHLMECAYIDQDSGKIVFDKVQNIMKLSDLSF